MKLNTRVILPLVAFFILFFTLMVTVFFFYKAGIRKTQFYESETKEKFALPEGILLPSQIFADKMKYNKQNIVMRGRVLLEPAVCEKKACPKEDSCCGCPYERNLFITDAGTLLTSKTAGHIRLIEPNGRPFCQRKPASCEYSCQDWEEGAIYNVFGAFFAESPPPGWKLSLEYYLTVTDKELVKRVLVGESISNFFNEITEMFKKLKTSGSYVLQ